MNLNGIKNIIFDLGGVILDIDYNLTVKAFEKLGIPNFKAQYSKMSQSNLFDNIETGKISPEEFRNLIREVAEKDVTDAEIDHAWNALILHLPQYRIEILKKLQDNYRLFLLSNTNKIHYDDYSEVIKRENGIEGLEPLFEKTYLSHEMGLRKPNPEIFNVVLNENNLVAEETLFIDDSPQHIASAKTLGIVTYHLENEDIGELF
ncbi:MAG: HAD family phosphatase [Bacteroidetes bacterium]|jgi:putative hydrolase of the HAD superfamily|nr:haloacid dehalogenase [Crocinitomicaceae bacterium]MCH9823349.1 HAD family phosphatase [Bacteroidota bacterium]|tara:strand:- start:31024 stop:31638 length:615 start_codon:yes stop_codon:yes gene_type:complete